MDNDRLAIIIALAEQGLLNTQIGERVGLKKARVAQIIKESGRLDLCGYQRRKAADISHGPRKPKRMRELPMQAYLRRVLRYDSKTGEFWWRRNRDRLPRWNGRHAGKQAGGWNSVHGYYEIRLDGELYYGHQIAWIYTHGSIPAGKQIDHANRNRGDNRIFNLRLATPGQNTMNREMRPKKDGLPRGVARKAGRFVASICHKEIGLYDTPAEAAAAYNAAALIKHGKFFDDV